MADTKEAVLMTEIARSEHRQWTRATVTRDGRIFVSYPRWSDNVPVSVGELLAVIIALLGPNPAEALCMRQIEEGTAPHRSTLRQLPS